MLTETIGQRRSSNQGLSFWLESLRMLSIAMPYLRTNQHSNHLPGGSTISLVLSVLSLPPQFVHSILAEDAKHLAWGHFQGRLQLMLKIPSEVNAGETHHTEE